jgi:hypothetical protein
MKALAKLFLSILILACSFTDAYAQLTIRSDSYGSKPGYIDNATLVVEPHGAYVEQSLYLSYSDHNQFPASQVEIVHRFELPANAVINDLWLWIGDSVMQARMLDTWTARAIYDSIVSRKRDPAFLSKNGNIYELHIYPLVSGKYRKIKLNFITPTRWIGKDGSADLPLKMLKDNNNPKKPVEVLFRQAVPIWGQPGIQELSVQKFVHLKDSTGFQYSSSLVADVGTLTSFTMGFSTNFVNGLFITTSDVEKDGTYFQYGLDPGSLFNLQVDPAPKHVLFALDLGGVHNKNFSTLIPNVKQLMRASTKPNDSINVIVAGAGKVDMPNAQWKLADTDSINNALDRFAASDWGKQIAVEKLPNILYADYYASLCWQFPGIENLATYKNYNDIVSALQAQNTADVIAAYAEGFEDAGLTSANIGSIITKIDSFFTRGGRLLLYYDYNRVGKELIGTHYVPGLTCTNRPDGSATLYRNPSGNIGIYFPESFVHYGFDYPQYTPDASVKIEVQDGAGKPVIISKKIGNGLLIISGIWSFKDDGALRGLLGAPLLGLNAATRNQQLTTMLTAVRAKFQQSPIDKIIVASNSDSLFQKTDALNWAASYLNGFGASQPHFTSINLLDGTGFTPPYLTDNQIQYYGSGYLLKTITGAGQGRHFETHLDTWPYIVTTLNAYAYPVADSLTMSVSVGGGSGTLRDLREVTPIPSDANKARFFIGSASTASVFQFNVRAKFAGIADAMTASTTFFVSHDTAHKDQVLPSMLGNENLRDLFNQHTKDTSSIVKLAMRYRLLCDYTALLALEPNDTIHFMKNPFDESLLDVKHLIDESLSDSLTLSSFPNPFNNQTSIVVMIKNTSRVNVSVYNMLGQLVKVIASGETVNGNKIYAWDGSDERHRTVSSGAYFVRLVAQEKSSGLEVARVRKVLFLK